ncbi:glycosyltransferase family 4 protein [Candidatus Ruminimicrobium bovinum]|uniref:glycosyltransferase family 4 protein n=1 Tax=Candidatus Ruminimicrobium bovinum TaxID=3242779 RepID=UPI0039B87FD1
MKKIVYCISTLRKSGPVIVLYNIVKNLDLTKYKPIIITLSKELQDTMINDFQSLNIEIVQLNLSRLKGFVFGGIKLKKTIQKINPNVIHCNGFRDILLTGLFISKKYKKMATIHCDFAIDYVLKYGFCIGKIMSFLQRKILSKFNNRIAVSGLLSMILNKKYSKMKFDYVDNGIDTEYFKPIENKIELKKKLNLPTDKKIFIWCGSFIERKDPITLVNVIKQIKNENLFFVFCGARGQLLEICKKELNNYKNVLFTGYVNNVKDYLQSSDFYVSTSLSEGFHLTVYESLACGLPVILTNIPVYNELKSNKIGLFFEIKNIETLKNKINTILDIDYKLYSNVSVNLIQNKFSAKLMSYKYQKFYN